MSFLDDFKRTNFQFESFVKDLDSEISKMKVEEWSNRIKKEQKKKQKMNKNEMPLDIRHSF